MHRRHRLMDVKGCCMPAAHIHQLQAFVLLVQIQVLIWKTRVDQMLTIRRRRCRLQRLFPVCRRWDAHWWSCEPSCSLLFAEMLQMSFKLDAQTLDIISMWSERVLSCLKISCGKRMTVIITYICLSKIFNSIFMLLVKIQAESAPSAGCHVSS